MGATKGQVVHRLSSQEMGWGEGARGEETMEREEEGGFV